MEEKESLTDVYDENSFDAFISFAGGIAFILLISIFYCLWE